MSDMDVSKLIERINNYLSAAAPRDRTYYATHPEVMLHEAAAALTAERERADKAEAEVARLKIEVSEVIEAGSSIDQELVQDVIDKATAAEAERDDLTRKLAEAEREIEAVLRERDAEVDARTIVEVNLADAERERDDLTRKLAEAEDTKAEAVFDCRFRTQEFGKHKADLERQLAEAVEVVRKCLNYIENTESELGITLDCGDRARAFIQTQEAGK